MERLSELVRTDLGGGVRRLSLQDVRLVDPRRTSGPINLGRRRVYDAAYAEVARCSQHVESAHHIGFDDFARRTIGGRDRAPRSQVQHDIAAVDSGSHRTVVTQVPRDDVEFGERLW